MTVQELINALKKVKDKTAEVRYSKGNTICPINITEMRYGWFVLTFDENVYNRNLRRR